MSLGHDNLSDEKLWLGFIEPRSSWSSVLALALSLIAGVYQLYWFVVGPAGAVYPSATGDVQHSERRGRSDYFADNIQERRALSLLGCGNGCRGHLPGSTERWYFRGPL